MLIAPGVCIPAILSCIFTWDKILRSDYWTSRATASDGEQSDAIKLNPNQIKSINNTVARFLSVVEIPVFGGIIMAILIAGEINFFSPQLMFMTEPMASIGKHPNMSGFKLF